MMSFTMTSNLEKIIVQKNKYISVWHIFFHPQQRMTGFEGEWHGTLYVAVYLDYTEKLFDKLQLMLFYSFHIVFGMNSEPS